MTVEVKDVFKDKKYPTWIKSHKTFKSNKKISKVFPEIGLANSEKEIQVDNSVEAKKAAIDLVHELQRELDRRFVSLGKFKEKKPDKFSEKRIKKLEKCKNIVQSIKTKLNKAPTKFLVLNNGRFTLNLPEDIKDVEDKVVFKSGEGLIRVYNKINETLRAGHFLAMEKIDNLPMFKEFSTKNVPNLKYLVKFSSDGPDGVWDIATMSMRGIQSCQTWDGVGNGNSAHVIGSMIDPMTGIVYLTSGGKFNEYGSKMIRRCVVRFVVNEKTKKPCIMLERMYPALDNETLKIFKNFIEEKTDKKFTVIYTQNGNPGEYYVPMAKAVKQLEPINQPYRDSGITYKSDINDKLAYLKDHSNTILEKLYIDVASKVLTAAKSIKIGSVPDASKEAFRAMRGSTYYYDYSGYIHQDVLAKTKAFFQKFDTSKFDSLSSFMDTALNEFAEKGEEVLYSSMKKSCLKYIPKSLGKVGDDVLKTVAKAASIKVAALVKEELNNIKPEKNSNNSNDEEVPAYVKLLN
jgi:hypothetical protein